MSLMSSSFHTGGPIENDPRAKDAQQRWGELKSDRTRHEQDWEEIARLIRPQRGGFSLSDASTRTMEKPLSSAPAMALNNLAAGLYGTLTNPATRWMGMTTPDPALNDSQEARVWLDTVSSRILASFQPAISPFYSAGIQLFSDICAFGNSAQYDEILPSERKIMDVTLSLAEVCWDIDAFGRVNQVVRKFGLKARAAIAMLGVQNVPKKVRDMADAHDQGKIWFWHHVQPNDDYVPGKLGPKGKAWLSTYACEIDCALVRVNAYDEMPFDIARWEVESGFTVGTGPGFMVLASARTHHRMDEATIRAAQFAADPTKLAADRDSWPMNGVVRPGSVVYGGLNMQGQPMLRNMDSHNGINLTLQEKDRKIEEIKDGMMWSLMNLAGRTGMTATEVMTIEEERQRLMAPQTGRIQHEYLAPKIARRFSMLWRAGQIPPPPESMKGAALEVEYLSGAAMAQKSREGASIVRLIEDITPLVGIKPRLAERIDEDEYLEALQSARGTPAAILRSREATDKIAAARAQQQQEMQQMQMAQAAGGVAKDMAGAAQAAGLTAAPQGAGMV
jgi:hypothetical protein